MAAPPGEIEKEFRCRPRFKGIENFLRRIAFNLGNTPSQTEVKIISCIPIDVTDLQHKIINLERELEDRKTGALRRPPTEVNTALCGPPMFRPVIPSVPCSISTEPPHCYPRSRSNSPPPHHSDSNSRCEHDGETAPCQMPPPCSPICDNFPLPCYTDPCRTRTPCQTPPSCQTPKRCRSPPPCHSPSTCYSPTASPTLSNCRPQTDYQYSNCHSPSTFKPSPPPACPNSCHVPNPTTPPCCSDSARYTSDCSSRLRRSAISFHYPGVTPVKYEPECDCDPHYSCNCPEGTNANQCRNLRNIFKKVALGGNKKNKCRTHFVYYAETMNSPFTKYPKQLDCSKNPPYKEKEKINRSYLTEMVRKQYKADKMAEKMSATSQFSSPICRDAAQGSETPYNYDSDVCSCCRGPFQNIDVVRHVRNDIFKVPQLRNERDNSVYYDSSLYDVVPVKERPTKTKNDDDIPRKKDHKVQIDFKNSPDVIRKPRVQICTLKNQPVTYVRGTRKALSKRKLSLKLPNKISTKRRFEPDNTSNSCSIDCGGVYSKRICERRQPKLETIPVEQKNAECLTISVNNTECQTASTKSVQLDAALPDENKTEVTLNQIKSILQSVLTEVKINAQVKTVPIEDSKRDAVVQKGASHSNMQANSSLMNSFSYSPYNIPYGPSCSRQTNNQLTYQTSPYGHLKYMQNYPLFIQTTGRQCACCFRNMPNSGKTVHGKPEATIATNTDAAGHQRSKETEKLIKEIYKSIAVNMDFPAKDTSTSEYDDLKSSNNSRKMFEFKYVPSKEYNKYKEESTEVVHKKDVQMTSTTPSFHKPAFRSNVVSNAASMRSQAVKKTDRMQKEREESYVGRKDTLVSSGTGSERDKQKPYVVEMPNATTTSYSDDTESPYTEESDDTVVTVAQTTKKKEKVGLFTKVCKLFKPRIRKKEKVEPPSESEEEQNESEASDSDDYQTVYSQRSKKQPQVKYSRDRSRYRPRPHSKVSFSKYYMAKEKQERGRRPGYSEQERAKRNPYMEQEYRRRWNENVSFHNNNSPRYSSERPVSKDSTQPSRRRPAFWQNYEARSATVEHNLPQTNIHVRESPTEVPKKSHSNGKGLAWLKKHKLGLQCGEQWKKLILEG